MQKLLTALEGIKYIAKNKYSEDIGVLTELERILREIPSKVEIYEKNRRDKNSADDIVKYVVGFLNDPDNQYFYIKNTLICLSCSL